MGLDFVGISFETANGNPASACAVSVVRIRNGEMADSYSTFINFPRVLGGFDPDKTELHGITPKDLIGAPAWQEVLPKITEFIGSDYVVCHNSEFHMPVITSASKEAGVPVPDFSYFCSRTLAQRAIPGLTRYRLADIAKSLGIGKFQQYDTEAHALLAAMSCVRFAEREELDSLAALMARNGIREGIMGRGREYVLDREETVPAAPVVESENSSAAASAAVIEPDAPAEVVAPEEPQKTVQPAPVASVEANVSSSLTIKGQRISFVGGFDPAERTSAKEKIAERGGKYLKNVRPDTTLLVIGMHHNPNLEGIVVAKAFNESGSKIQFLNKDEFFSALGV